ncbi:hypothetical protein ACFQ1E_07630 [Sphingomonas canadensis]|uniref:Uncharacterized protein n=1 Tax=Sphingomonas canadensis TaxID=1219257 RepID=A0ABW3H3W4_9SPHN|nr:hypothetical protein [Sphingomonas canadensis]MCW3835906.1 hypothetical protein [Sphingomonas canadensis]
MEWHRRTSAALLLRAAGMLLLSIAALAGQALRGMAPGALAMLLAAAAFLAASLGAALLFEGRGLFDLVPVPGRWHGGGNGQV